MNQVILHQTPLEDIRAFIVEAVADQFKKCQLNKPAEPEKLLTRNEVSKSYGISLPTLSEYTKKGIVKAMRVGTCIRYKQCDLENALIEVKTSNKR